MVPLTAKLKTGDVVRLALMLFLVLVVTGLDGQTTKVKFDNSLENQDEASITRVVALIAH